MKRCFIFWAILAAGTGLAFAQELNMPAADNPPAATTPPLPAENAAQKNKLGMAELDKKQAGEIRALEEKMELNRKKLLEEIKSYQEQIVLVKKKYNSEKYAIMDRLEPGSGSRLAKRDKDLAELEIQLKKDLNEVNSAQGLEASKGSLTKEKQDKFQTDRKRIIDGHSAKKRELLSK